MGYERNDRRYGNGYGRDDYGRDPRYGDPDDRGFFDRAGDEIKSWFGDEEAERRRRMDERYDERYDRNHPRNRYDESHYDGGRFAGSGPGAYPGNDRYSTWHRSNQSAGPNDGDRGYARGYAPHADHYGGARSAGHDDEHGYHGWRNRQISELDRDYDEYRRENQSRFASEFSSWRQNRQAQRSSLQQVQEHMEVVGSDGAHVGKVDHVRADRILLTRTDRDAGGHHHSIPSSWIRTVDDKVHLAKTAEQAQQAWRDEERNQGLFGGDRDGDRDATNLNRSFSGTY